MDYLHVLHACTDQAIGAAIADAIGKLIKIDKSLLQKDASERSIAHRLAMHLEPHFPEHQVDVEYNRMGDAPKQVAWSDSPERVFPDIIVHLRGTPTNILAIELKKDSNHQSRVNDILKLRAYRRELQYQHALFVRFCVGKDAGEISECEWVHV